MLGLLIAYVQGRGGVLDDRGIVIETEMHAEWDPLDSSWDEEGIDSGTDGVTDIPSNQGVIHRWSHRAVAVGGLLAMAAMFLMLLYAGWLFSGWIGKSLLGVPGAYGNIAGLVVTVALLLGYSMLSWRWSKARRGIRARRGARDLGDCIEIFGLVEQSKRCGACAFLIHDLKPESDGCVRCPECGGAWNTKQWIDYLRSDRVGILRHLKRRHRERACLCDARRQVFMVLGHMDKTARDAMVRAKKGGLDVLDVLLLAAILTMLAGGIIGIVVFASRYGTTRGGAIALGITITLLVMLVVYSLNLARVHIRVRRLRWLALDLIDDRVCPNCEHTLGDERHPIDGTLVCDGCGLAWDPQTSSRRHHARKRVNDERFKHDSVFEEPR